MSDSLARRFVNTCSLGDMDEFLNTLSSLSIEQRNEIIEFDHYACFRVAAANGHVDIVNCIFRQVTSVTNELPVEDALIPIVLDNDGEGLKSALNNGHLNILKLILEQGILFLNIGEIIVENPKFIKTIWDSPLRNYIISLFECCCAKSISSVQRILEMVPESSHDLLLEHIENKHLECYFGNGSPFLRACYAGKLDILQLLWQLYSNEYKKKIIKNQLALGFLNAAKNGHLTILKQLVEWVASEQKIELLKTEDFNAFVYAADRGYLEIIQFIWQSLPPSLQLEALKASNFAAYRLATKNQHVPVIKFLEDNTDEETRRKMKKAVNQGVLPTKYDF